MPSFQCKIATSNGSVTNKNLTADTKTALKKRLENDGNFVLEIKGPDRLGHLLKHSNRLRRFKTNDFYSFNQEFSALVRAGLSIVSALDAIIDNDIESELTDLLKEIRNDIKTGESLSGAFGKQTHVFPKLYVASLQAGEKSGNIPLAISRYIEYMKKTSETRKKVISASVYPIILTVVSLFVLVFLFMYVVPAVAGTFLDTGSKLPLITAILIESSTMIKSNLMYCFIISFFIAAGCYYFKKSETGQIYIDRWKLTLPVLGELYRAYSTSKFARTLATVLGGGLTLVDSVHISSGTLNNLFLKQRLETVIKHLTEGGGFADSLSMENVFPKLAVRMVQAGEGSGALEEILNEIADFYDSEVDIKLSVLTSAIEPALMILMGLLIGVIVLALYMPIFQLAGTVS